MSKLTQKTLGEISNNFDNVRVPLSVTEREKLEKKYRYYGAQGVIDYVDAYLFNGEYILVAEDGENLKSQKNNICNFVTGKFWVNNHAHIINASNGHNTKYLYYKLSLVNFKNYVTGSAQPKLTKDNLNSIVLHIHKDGEQQKIAAALSALDAKIDCNNRINAELEALAKMLYDYWFVQFDFPDANGKPYKSSGGKMVYNATLKREIPEGWRSKKIGDYAEVLKGDLITARDAKQGSIKVVAAGIDFSYTHSESNRAKNTITISGSGANAGFINFWREPIFASDCITVRGASDMETLLLLYHLKFIQSYILSQATGSAQPHVYPGDIRGLDYLIPGGELIDEFGKLAIPMNDQIAKNLAENQQLAQLRDWLLPLLMNGQVTVA